MKEVKETHQKGLITKENDFVFPINGDFGIQIAKDGRVWICINGIAFLRFKPEVSFSEKSNGKEKPKGQVLYLW